MRQLVSLAVADRLLGVPPGYPSWQMADAAARSKFLVTWLSSAHARGALLTERGLEFLNRARRRVAELHRVGEEMAQTFGLRVIKGPRIAQYYPAGLLRQSGDADLVAPDEAALWRCVQRLQDYYAAVPQCVSVLAGTGGRHVFVAMKWPAEESLLDKPMGADVSTCAFSGNFHGVPARAEAPPHDDLAGLFAVAEERFQRKFRIKDLLDLLVLAEILEARLGGALAATVAQQAGELALAPELCQLIKKTDERVSVPEAWRHVWECLRPLAQEEKAKRRSGERGRQRPVFGLPLDRVNSGDHALAVHHTRVGDIATTPIGSCLLLDYPVLTEELLEEAIGCAQKLRAGERG